MLRVWTDTDSTWRKMLVEMAACLGKEVAEGTIIDEKSRRE
jgi:hypothetical protein